MHKNIYNVFIRSYIDIYIEIQASQAGRQILRFIDLLPDEPRDTAPASSPLSGKLSDGTHGVSLP